VGCKKLTYYEEGCTSEKSDFFSWGIYKKGVTASKKRYNYYPYGKVLRSYSNGETDRYMLTGSERDVETGYDHFDFRNYDSDIGRWLSIDPLAAEMPSWSPYSFVFNNPLIFVDPDGRYPIYVITRSYAPFKTFGPGNNWYGDNRGHTLDRGASYRSLASINYDTETRQSSAFGGLTRSHTVDGSKDATSRTFVDNRSKGSNIDVHSAGKNAAQPGAWDIDQFTKLSITTDGNIKKNHILNISGTISGDDFPNQESFIYDSDGNSLWLGNYVTTGDRQSGPVTDLPFENEGDVSINVNISINVNSDGIFQGVTQGDQTFTIGEWNAKFE